MTTLGSALARVRPLVERLDARSLRERALVFGAGVAILYMAWQATLMDPLTARAKAAGARSLRSSSFQAMHCSKSAATMRLWRA